MAEAWTTKNRHRKEASSATTAGCAQEHALHSPPRSSSLASYATKHCQYRLQATAQRYLTTGAKEGFSYEVQDCLRQQCPIVSAFSPSLWFPTSWWYGMRWSACWSLPPHVTTLSSSEHPVSGSQKHITSWFDTCYLPMISHKSNRNWLCGSCCTFQLKRPAAIYESQKRSKMMRPTWRK